MGSKDAAVMLSGAVIEGSLSWRSRACSPRDKLEAKDKENGPTRKEMLPVEEANVDPSAANSAVLIVAYGRKNTPVPRLSL